MHDRYLFRGKRISENSKNGKWVIGYYAGAENSIHYIKANTIEYFAVDPATIGQCTGLRDKNGKLIFEGDFARTSKGLLLTVHYNKAQYELGNKEKNGYFVLSIYKPEELEIIGNIHDRTEEEA